MPRLEFVDGVGFLPIAEPPQYGREYFEKYAAYGQTTLGVALNSLRAGLVDRYLPQPAHIVDIGVGDGSFIRACRRDAYGYDVNLVAREMLERNGDWVDISTSMSIYAASFWDSLEHIEKPEEIVSKVDAYCFVSIPVFINEAHILTSKHYRPNEHYWYFTRAGLIAWFWRLGFVCLEMSEMETALGREDIGTFVFKRK